LTVVLITEAVVQAVERLAQKDDVFSFKVESKHGVSLYHSSPAGVDQDNADDDSEEGDDDIEEKQHPVEDIGEENEEDEYTANDIEEAIEEEDGVERHKDDN
jgi:hypothetical protein